MLAETESLLNGGNTLTTNRIDQLRAQLGDSDQAERYIGIAEERSALNSLKSKGRFEDGFFAGGLSGSHLAENSLNPASWLTNPTKSAIGSAAGVLSMAGDAAMVAKFLHPMALAKVVAAQGAGYAGLRTIDAVTGSRNPAREFMSRFQSEAGNSARENATAGGLPQGSESSLQERAALTRAILKAVERPPEGQAQAALGHGGAQQGKAASGAPGALNQASEVLESLSQREKVRINADLYSDKTQGSDSDKINTENDHRLVIPVRGYTVERSRDSVANPARYMRKIAGHMEKRADLGDELEALVGPQHSGTIRTMVDRLNNQAHSYADAVSHAEDAINSLPEALLSPAWDLWLSHERQIKHTYRA